jgi:hypothetical protein
VNENMGGGVKTLRRVKKKDVRKGVAIEKEA